MKIVADVGSNHRGSLELALKQIVAAKECGATDVKFQKFSAKELYGFGELESVHSIRDEWLPNLKAQANACKIGFMCSAFSPEGVKIVDPYVDWHKVASSEFLHYEIIEAIKETGKPWIASTGAAHFAEVQFIVDNYQPTALMECVARYPAPCDNYDLATLQKWLAYGRTNGPVKRPRGAYDIQLGISDHTLTDSLALTSIGFGATIFEKHFDALCGDMPINGPWYDSTPDSSVSLGPMEMRGYCRAIREAFSAIGDGIKQPRHQHDAMLRYRRRLIITKDLPKGSKLKPHENYGIFRSLKDDTRGDKTIKQKWYEGKTLKVAKVAGDSLWETDVE